MNIQIENFSEEIRESATLAINQQALERRSCGEDICHLGFGQSPFPVHPKITSLLEKNAHRKEYLSSQGLVELRHQIVSYHEKRGYSFNIDQVFIGPGSKELIYDLLLLLKGPVYIPSPSWVSYGPQARILKKYVHFIPTERENKYKVTPEQLKESVKSHDRSIQKLLIINSPSNPTGIVYHREDIRELVKVCREENILVLSDEIYREIYFNETPPPGFSLFYPEGTFTTSGLSKVFSAGGYRLGFMVIPPGAEEFKRSLLSLISETFSAVSTPIQYAAIAAYEDSSEVRSYNDLCRRIHRTCGLYLREKLVEMGFGCPKPEGAFYIFPDLENLKSEIIGKLGIKKVSDLSFHLFKNHNLATLPGVSFYTPEDYFALRLAHVDYEGSEVLKAAETESLNQTFIENHCKNLVKSVERFKEFIETIK